MVLAQAKPNTLWTQHFPHSFEQALNPFRQRLIGFQEDIELIYHQTPHKYSAWTDITIKWSHLVLIQRNITPLNPINLF